MPTFKPNPDYLGDDVTYPSAERAGQTVELAEHEKDDMFIATFPDGKTFDLRTSDIAEPLCPDCGHDLTKRESLTVSTDGWYSYEGRMEDGVLLIDYNTLDPSGYESFELYCANCGAENPCEYDDDQPDPNLTLTMDNVLVELKRVYDDEDREVNGGDMVEVIGHVAAGDYAMALVLIDEFWPKEEADCDLPCSIDPCDPNDAACKRGGEEEDDGARV